MGDRHLRPYVVLNSAMSLDGKIATSSGDSRLSSREDLERVHTLRASVDAIMVGIGTLMADNPKLTLKLVPGHNPTRIIVDSKARTPLDAYVVRNALQTPTIIATTTKAPKSKIKRLTKAGAITLACGKGPQVDLRLLLWRLRARNIGRLLLEGGGTLAWSMLRNNLVDEISVAIAPRILGGANATTLADGEGFSRVKDAVKLRLLGTKKYGKDLVLRYRVLDQA